MSKYAARLLKQYERKVKLLLLESYVRSKQIIKDYKDKV